MNVLEPQRHSLTGAQRKRRSEYHFARLARRSFGDDFAVEQQPPALLRDERTSIIASRGSFEVARPDDTELVLRHFGSGFVESPVEIDVFIEAHPGVAREVRVCEIESKQSIAAAARRRARVDVPAEAE